MEKKGKDQAPKKPNALRVDCEVKGDTKECELLTRPLGQLHSIIYNRDRLKID